MAFDTYEKHDLIDEVKKIVETQNSLLKTIYSAGSAFDDYEDLATTQQDNAEKLNENLKLFLSLVNEVKVRQDGLGKSIFQIQRDMSNLRKDLKLILKPTPSTAKPSTAKRKAAKKKTAKNKTGAD